MPDGFSRLTKQTCTNSAVQECSWLFDGQQLLVATQQYLSCEQ
jgi:hypothetical protein